MESERPQLPLTFLRIAGAFSSSPANAMICPRANASIWANEPLHGFDHCDGRALRGLELRQSSSQTAILCNLKRISNSCFNFSAKSPWEKEHPRAKCNFPFLGIDFGSSFGPSPLNNVDGVIWSEIGFGAPSLQHCLRGRGGGAWKKPYPQKGKLHFARGCS